MPEWLKAVLIAIPASLAWTLIMDRFAKRYRIRERTGEWMDRGVESWQDRQIMKR